MTCPEFDDLWLRADGRCELCRAVGSETGHGVLCIDHDETIGIWAVRGLLCSRCNTSLSLSSASHRPEVASYLARPWHVPALKKAGVKTHLPEPDVGSRVRGGLIRYQRRADGWVREKGWSRPVEWWRITQRHRPDRIEILR